MTVTAFPSPHGLATVGMWMQLVLLAHGVHLLMVSWCFNNGGVPWNPQSYEPYDWYDVPIRKLGTMVSNWVIIHFFSWNTWITWCWQLRVHGFWTTGRFCHLLRRCTHTVSHFGRKWLLMILRDKIIHQLIQVQVRRISQMNGGVSVDTS